VSLSSSQLTPTLNTLGAQLTSGLVP
jgi:hypothetical protein